MHTAAYAAVFKGVYLSTEGYGQKSVSVYQLTYFIGLLYRSFFTGWRITVVNFFWAQICSSYAISNHRYVWSVQFLVVGSYRFERRIPSLRVPDPLASMRSNGMRTSPNPQIKQ